MHVITPIGAVVRPNCFVILVVSTHTHKKSEVGAH